jgi:solute carrier family 25 protein 39/40
LALQNTVDRVVTPLDVVRVRLQSQSPISKPPSLPVAYSKLPPNLGVTACCREVFFVSSTESACLVAPNSHSTLDSLTHCAVNETQARTFTGTFDAIRKIARYEGVSNLWRGLSPTLVMAVPANVIYFTGYDSLRYSKKSPLYGRLTDNTAPLVAGSLARIAAATAIGPIEMFRTRLQATSALRERGNPNSPGYFTATMRGMGALVKEQGYTSLWRGLSMTLWRDVPFSGLYWWGYETLRTRISYLPIQALRKDANGTHTGTFLSSFAAGFISGGFSSIVTQPFDVGKTRQQVFIHATETDTKGTGKPTVPAPKVPRESMARVLVDIWREDGMSGLWRGVTARTLKVAPACAIMISSYELGKRFSTKKVV